MDRTVLDAHGWTDFQPVLDFREQLDESSRFTWDDDTRDIHIYLGKCKIIGGGALEFGDATYVTYSLELKVLDDGSNGIWKQIQHETRTTLPTS